jgi:hypothetical protein
MTGAGFAHLIRWSAGFMMVLAAEAALVVAERSRMCPRAGLVLLDVGEACGRVARGMLPPRRAS